MRINTGTHKFNLKFGTIAEKVEWTNALRATQARYEEEVNENSMALPDLRRLKTRSGDKNEANLELSDLMRDDDVSQ